MEFIKGASSKFIRFGVDDRRALSKTQVFCCSFHAAFNGIITVDEGFRGYFDAKFLAGSEEGFGTDSCCDVRRFPRKKCGLSIAFVIKKTGCLTADGLVINTDGGGRADVLLMRMTGDWEGVFSRNSTSWSEDAPMIMAL